MAKKPTASQMNEWESILQAEWLWNIDLTEWFWTARKKVSKKSVKNLIF